MVIGQASQRTFAVSTSKMQRAVGTYQAEVFRDRMFRIRSMYLDHLDHLDHPFRLYYCTQSLSITPDTLPCRKHG